MENNINHKVAVLGGGSFGTVIANNISANGHAVSLWVRDQVHANEINASGENTAYLPGYKLNSNVFVSADLEGSVQDCGCVIFAVPSSAFRQIARQISEYLTKDTTVISTAKGVESATFLLPSQVL